MAQAIPEAKGVSFMTGRRAISLVIMIEGIRVADIGRAPVACVRPRTLPILRLALSTTSRPSVLVNHSRFAVDPQAGDTYATGRYKAKRP